MFFGGSSGPAHALAVEHVDTYLTWGEVPADVAAKLANLGALVCANCAACRARRLSSTQAGLELQMLATL